MTEAIGPWLSSPPAIGEIEAGGEGLNGQARRAKRDLSDEIGD